MNLNTLVATAHSMAVDKGWYEGTTTKSPLEAHMLIVTEVAEASEEVRNGNPPVYQVVQALGHGKKIALPFTEDWTENGKPEGELIELADVIIRIADYCGYMGWDLQEAVNLKLNYNSKRPARHGGKLK